MFSAMRATERPPPPRKTQASKVQSTIKGVKFKDDAQGLERANTTDMQFTTSGLPSTVMQPPPKGDRHPVAPRLLTY